MLNRNYNERSWAIDIISEINHWSSTRDVIIKRAGGENTLISAEELRFPDVLLFGDQNQGLILQGWELKMPDTPINDRNFIDDATRKANILGLNSFVIWNVTNAQLFVKQQNGFQILHTWNSLSHIQNRNQVANSIEEILSTLRVILSDLNHYFLNGIIQPARIVDTLTSDRIIDVIFQSSGQYAQALQDFSLQNNEFEDEVTMWWISANLGYPENSNKWQILANSNLLSIFNKFIFTHILKSVNINASSVDSINHNIGLISGLEVFNEISSVADFWNILHSNIGESLLPENSWNNFVELNGFLRESNFSLINPDFFQLIIDKLMVKNKQKVAGQFITPEPLAKLITKIVIEDPNQNVIDPCCGTGTIVKAIYDFKVERRVIEPLNSLWASDRFSYPLKLATFALSQPNNFGKRLQIFQSDIVDIHHGMTITLHHPSNGSEIEVELPLFKYVISNLPFVRQEDINTLNNTITQINSRIMDLTSEPKGLLSKSDLYAYLPFYIWFFLDIGGRLGMIISNSWLATDWGKQFFNLVRRFYEVEFIITSGLSRWFNNAKIVTNIVVLKKKSVLSEIQDQSIKFVTIKKSIEDLANPDTQQNIKSSMVTFSNNENEFVQVRTNNNDIFDLTQRVNLPLSSNFADLSWIPEFLQHSTMINQLFIIKRGSRRGWDPLFYPSTRNEIESEFLLPVLKTPQSLLNPLAQPDGLAFSCRKSIENLRSENLLGALNWIESFENLTNEKGVPLPISLRLPGVEWYTMLPNNLAEIVTALNPGDRLFFSRFINPSFVNQRLISLFRRNTNIDLELCHALLNCTSSLFFIEALGFGRGEGVLDLTASKFKKGMQILNPDQVTSSQRSRIISSFNVLLQRNTLPITEELTKEDRRTFDLEVLNTFGISNLYERIKSSLLTLYNIRLAVKN